MLSRLSEGLRWRPETLIGMLWAYFALHKATGHLDTLTMAASTRPKRHGEPLIPYRSKHSTRRARVLPHNRLIDIMLARSKMLLGFMSFAAEDGDDFEQIYIKGIVATVHAIKGVQFAYHDKLAFVFATIRRGRA